eukprot:Tamp_03551.p2 GENE.Tamp_03551~~Tamp_03551.p2  ORF type:complete len:515 (-),score=118.14 Tamp_03551:2123-3541(-)
MELNLPLRVHYADANTELSGVVCRDDVRIGEYKGRVAFACWTNAPNEMFWARMGNGVLGLAPRYQKQHDEDQHPLPPPMLLGLTAPNAKDSNVAGLPPRFSFMASKTAAELQLGGYVAGSVTGNMHKVQSLSTKSYTLSIASIKIGDEFDSAQELLTFDPTDTHHHIPALLDTGSPCIMLPGGQEDGTMLRSPYSLYQDYAKKWSKMFITVNGINVGLELNRADLEVEHHTFLDQAWGTSVRPCVMPVNWAMKPPHQTPIVLGAVFFRAYNVLFDLSKSSPSVPPTLGLGKINPSYNIIGISDYAANVKGGDGANVHRVFVQHTPTKITSKNREEVGVANPNGHQFLAQIFVGTPRQPLRVVVDTGSPLFGLFVSPEAVGKYTGTDTGVAHRRPPPLHLAQATGAATTATTPKVSSSVAATRASAKANMGSVIKILPVVGVVVLLLLLLFLKYRRHIMLQVYYATKPDLPYR